jgi:mRNA-degrading endonuclease RelE of RelBE toxin-antitoxin system
VIWQLIFSKSAQKSLRKFPLADRRRIDRSLDGLASDPLQGDVRPLTGQPAEFRLRAGDYRIFFDLDHPQHTVRVHDVVRRTTSTYRRR